MGKPNKQLPPPNPDYGGFTPFTETFMRELGYVHESVVEEITSTTPRSRARWKEIQGIMFGNEKWYAIADIEEVLSRKLADKHGHERHAAETVVL